MASYYMQGGDGREYGPISDEQLKRWQREGRADATTQIRPEHELNWRPLGTMPELAVTRIGPPPLPLSIAGSPANQDLAKGLVNGPGIFIMVSTGLSTLVTLLSIAINVFQIGIGTFSGAKGGLEFMLQGTFGLVANLILLVISILIFIGAVKMIKLKSHGWAMAASILCLICSNPCCCPLGLAAGIWSLIVLSKPEVKSAFES